MSLALLAVSNKAVQNMFNCAFPIFWSIFQKLWIFHKEKFLLGRRKLRRPRRNLVLGTGIFSGPKKGIVLGRRKLRRPRKNSFRRHIRRFWKRSLKIGNAQLNVFCTALLGHPNVYWYTGQTLNPLSVHFDLLYKLFSAELSSASQVGLALTSYQCRITCVTCTHSLCNTQ